MRPTDLQFAHLINPAGNAGRMGDLKTDDRSVLVLPAVLSTVDAAAFINRKPQTLRKWSCQEIGPIKPIRIFGRLAWRVSDLRALLEG